MREQCYLRPLILTEQGLEGSNKLDAYPTATEKEVYQRSCVVIILVKGPSDQTAAWRWGQR